MFVQRGQDWDDAVDGEQVGLALELVDPDASYTEVAWSHFQSHKDSNHVLYHIGAQ
jgi:hypothetical protein